MIVIRRHRPRDPERMQQEMEVVFRALMPAQPAVSNGQHALWRPSLEVYETDDALVVRVEIAGLDGIDGAQLSVVVDGDRLVVRGERPDPSPADRRSYHEARIPYGAFGADIYIPFPVDADRTEAEYHNGFLRIVLPRTVARTVYSRRPEEAGRGQGAR